MYTWLQKSILDSIFLGAIHSLPPPVTPLPQLELPRRINGTITELQRGNIQFAARGKLICLWVYRFIGLIVEELKENLLQPQNN